MVRLLNLSIEPKDLSADMAFLRCFLICTPSFMCVNFRKSHLKMDTQRLSTPLQLVSFSIANFKFLTGSARNGKKTHVPWHGKLAESCIQYWSQTRAFPFTESYDVLTRFLLKPIKRDQETECPMKHQSEIFVLSFCIVTLVTLSEKYPLVKTS